MKKILVISGHPSKTSFNYALYESYLRGALETGAELRQIAVTDLPLERYLRYDHFSKDDIGPELRSARADVLWAEHIVFIHPNWWGGMPAIFKCFIDMVFDAGFAFKYSSHSPLPDKLLKGRTARIICTMDTPVFIYKYIFRAPGVNQLKSCILQFCGISPVAVTLLAPTRRATPALRQKFLTKVYLLGRACA